MAGPTACQARQRAAHQLLVPRWRPQAPARPQRAAVARAATPRRALATLARRQRHRRRQPAQAAWLLPRPAASAAGSDRGAPASAPRHDVRFRRLHSRAHRPKASTRRCSGTRASGWPAASRLRAARQCRRRCALRLRPALRRPAAAARAPCAPPSPPGACRPRSSRAAPRRLQLAPAPRLVGAQKAKAHTRADTPAPVRPSDAPPHRRLALRQALDAQQRAPRRSARCAVP